MAKSLYEHGVEMSLEDLLKTVPESHEKLRNALKTVAEKGVRGMSREELKYTGREIIRLARKRMRELERTGRDDSPAYIEYKKRGLKTSLAGKNINVLKHELKEAFEFLTRKTSIVPEVDVYNRWLNKHLGAETTYEQRKDIWDVVGRIEEEFPNKFTNYGYNEVIQKVAEVVKDYNYDLDKATKALQEYYKEIKLKDKEENGTGEELNERTRGGWAEEMKSRRFTKDNLSID